MRIPLLLCFTGFVLSNFVVAEPTTVTDGAELFQANCAYCHARSLPRMPSREGLKEKDPRDIFSTISGGVMA